MVSLGGDRRSPGGGGRSFSEESDDGDISLLTDVLDADRYHITIFPVTTWIIIIIQAISIMGLLVCLFLVSDIHYLNISHIVLWIIVVATSCCLYRYHRALKSYGYLLFYKKTIVFLWLPCVTLCCGNAVLLLCSSVLDMVCPHGDFCPLSSKMQSKYYLWIIVLAEILILFPNNITYIWMITCFVKSNITPDMHDEMFTNSIASHCPTHEIGFRDEDYRDDIMERQTDLIRYLKQHNVHLSMKILQLTEDLEHLRGVIDV